MKLRVISIFSLFSFASVIAILIAMMIILLSYFGVIDREGDIVFISNEIISNQIGIPLDDLEDLEGM